MYDSDENARESGKDGSDTNSIDYFKALWGKVVTAAAASFKLKEEKVWKDENNAEINLNKYALIVKDNQKRLKPGFPLGFFNFTALSLTYVEGKSVFRSSGLGNLFTLFKEKLKNY